MLEIQVPSLTSDKVYVVKRGRNGAWYCSCPAWKYQHKNPAERTCKHINALAESLVTHVTISVKPQAGRHAA